MSKSIVSVGLYIDDPRVVNCEFGKLGTLADGDVVLYQPFFFQNWDTEATCRVFNHWKNELSDAYNERKTIVVYMPYPWLKYWDQEGEERDLFYHLPVSFGFPYTSKEIKKIRVEDDADFLREYWELVGDISKGMLTIDKLADGVKRILKTHTGNKAIGVLSWEEDNRLGNVLFLPPFESKNGKIYAGGEEITSKVCDAIIKMDQNLKKPKNKEEKKIPEWVSGIKLPKEDEFETKLEEVEGSIQKLKEQKSKIEQEKQDYTRIKGLLYGGGHNLEDLIRDVLKKLGFENVRSIRKSEFEVDVVFEYEGNIFIGEVEGKDNRAIDKDKVGQLVTTFAEFSKHQEDCVPDRGFLFGNGYRLIEPEKRGLGFTEGAIKTAKNLNCVLIETKYLYEIAKVIQEGADEEYCKKIRNLIIEAESGIFKDLV